MPGSLPSEILVNDTPQEVDLIKVEENHYHLIVNGRSFNVDVVNKDAKNPHILINGRSYKPEVKDDTDLLLEKLGMNVKNKKDVKELKAPMPGLVLDIRVEAGKAVKVNDPLLVLEAMKMENVLKSPVEAVVKSVMVSKGDAIEKNTLLITFE